MDGRVRSFIPKPNGGNKPPEIDGAIPMKKIILALGLGVLSTAAFAQAPDFAAADADGDGAVSLAEAKAAMPDTDEAAIVAADANNDGALSQDEYTALTSG